jgi:TRAP-type C4-dicarboxylate transport system substrate-binding protein
MRQRLLRSAAAIVGLSLAACGGNDASTASAPQDAASSTTESDATTPPKAGSPAASVLRINVGNVNESAAGEGETLKYFAKQVEDLSDGTMKVHFEWDLDGTTGELRHPTAEAVESGEVDMAAEWAGAWGTQGVTAAQALQTPFLIRSYEQAAAVVNDDDLVSSILGGLDGAGVVGVTMFPVDMRPIIDFETQISGPADLSGDVFRSPWSNETWPLLTALGADPQNYPSKPSARDFSPTNQRSLPAGHVVGNLPLGFRFYTIVANKNFWSGLTDDQRDTLTAAALAARDFAVSTVTSAHALEKMAAVCDRGITIDQLEPAAIDAFLAAAAPTIATLKADQFTATAIDRIEQLGEGLAPTIFPSCASTGAAPSATVFPEGVYRFEITDDDLEKAEINPDYWADDRGVFTYTLKDGRFTWQQQTDPSVASPASGEGTYTVDGTFLTMTELAGPDNEPNPTVMTWEVASDGSLHFAIVTASFDYVRFIYGEPWIRIGDA